MLHTIIKILIIAMLALFAYAGYTTISEAKAGTFNNTLSLLNLQRVKMHRRTYNKPVTISLIPIIKKAVRTASRKKRCET